MGASSPVAHASENGATAYPLGVNTIMAGGMPAPRKTWIQNYTAYYHSESLADSRGRNSIPGFRADVVVNATRVFHNWGAEAGPFRLLSGIVVPVSQNKVGVAPDADSHLGIGDVELQPLYLGYSSKRDKFFCFTGVDLYVPSNTKVSNNFYAINPSTYLTWMPMPKLELSSALSVEFHINDAHTNYKSGTLIANDWGANYRPFKRLNTLGVGIGGYSVIQLTDDKVSGRTFQDGHRQRGFAVGPQLLYCGNFGAVGFKWEREFEMRNRPQGNKLWFQLMIPLKL